MTTVHTLASGSSGNAAVLSCGDTHLLIDAGISCRRITVALKELGLTPADLTAILITHTHSDHISGLNTLLKKTACPLLATPRTCRELDCRFPGIEPRLIEAEGAVTLGEVDIQPIPTSHDASGSCGWRLDTEGGSVGLLTDTGYVTDEALDLLDDIRAKLPLEIKKAQELVRAREEYVSSAKKEVEKMLRQAELDAKVIVSESETLQQARQRSSEIIRRAESRSKELYHVANTYTEDALRRTEEAIQMALDEVKESRVRFRAASQEQMQAQKEQILVDAERQAKEIVDTAEHQAAEHWKRFQLQAGQLIQAHAELQEMFKGMANR